MSIYIGKDFNIVSHHGNVLKTQWEGTRHSLEWLHYKTLTTSNIPEDVK